LLDKARLAVQCLLALKLAMHSVQAIAVRSMLAARPWELGKTLLTVHCVLASQSLTVHFMEMVYGDVQICSTAQRCVLQRASYWQFTL
jgi:hypothetical protein